MSGGIVSFAGLFFTLLKLAQSSTYDPPGGARAELSRFSREDGPGRLTGTVGSSVSRQVTHSSKDVWAIQSAME